MKVDFSVITIYEVFALILSAIAILIPIIQWVYRKWIVKPQLIHYPNGSAILFFNQSGSYLRIDGVFEALRKPVSIKNVNLHVARQIDSRTLNLTWSSFISPVSQKIIGNSLQTNETAHAIRIAEDSMMCAFIEFADEYDSFGKTFLSTTKELFAKTSDFLIRFQNYPDALKAYQALPEYQTAKTRIEKEYFWEVGKYDISLEASYQNKKKVFSYEFALSAEDCNKLTENVDEMLISSLKSAYNVPWNYQFVRVELKQKTER